MKTTLTIQESAELIKRGVSENRAHEIKVYDDPLSEWAHRGCPLFTLTDLLSLLPQAERDLGGITVGFDVERGKWASSYEFSDYMARDDELIDSLYKLTLHLLDTHIKLD